MNESEVQLSIVSTLYNSRRYIEEFYKRVSETADSLKVNYELLLVNDGSPDNSLTIARTIAKQDSKIRVINLSRNFGHHNAMLAGLNESKGEHVFLIDIDLEEEPEVLADFWGELQDSAGIDSIYGVSQKREGGVIRKNLGSAFYTIFNSLSSTQIPENLLTVRLMSRRYVNALLKYEENSLFLGGLFADTGFIQKPKVIVKDYKGETSYTLRKRISLLVNAVTSFSSKPLEFFVYLGVFVSLFSVLAILVVLFQKLALGIDIAGWASVMVVLSFFGGLQILSIGVIGTYLGKVFEEVKRRPRYIIQDVYVKGKE